MLSSRSPLRASAPRTVRPGVEALESRDVPAAPVITSLNVQPLQGNQVRVYGTLTDENPFLTSVILGGKVCGLVFATSSGTFEYTGNASGLGEITAFAYDIETLTSNIATTTLTSAAPVIQDFCASQGIGGYWTFTGRVIDESPMGLQVRLGGIPSLSNVIVMANQEGYFSYTVLLTSMDTGTATAVVTDMWGLTSNIAQWQI